MWDNVKVAISFTARRFTMGFRSHGPKPEAAAGSCIAPISRISRSLALCFPRFAALICSWSCEHVISVRVYLLGISNRHKAVYDPVGCCSSAGSRTIIARVLPRQLFTKFQLSPRLLPLVILSLHTCVYT